MVLPSLAAVAVNDRPDPLSVTAWPVTVPLTARGLLMPQAAVLVTIRAPASAPPLWVKKPEYAVVTPVAVLTAVISQLPARFAFAGGGDGGGVGSGGGVGDGGGVGVGDGEGAGVGAGVGAAA